MLYISEAQALVGQWLERLSNTSQPLPYRDALSECIYDLNLLIDKALKDELDSIESFEAGLENYSVNTKIHAIA